MHRIGITEVGQILRYLHHVAPIRSDMVEDGLYCCHRALRLLFNRMRMHVFGIDVRVLVVERRSSGTGDKHEIASPRNVNGRRVRHRMRLFRLGMHGLEFEGLLRLCHNSHFSTPSNLPRVLLSPHANCRAQRPPHLAAS